MPTYTVAEFRTEIRNWSNIQSSIASDNIVDWTVTRAKEFYITDTVTAYDANTAITRNDDNLVAILASAFLVSYTNGDVNLTEVKLDEFSFKEDTDLQAPYAKFVDRFWSWLRSLEARGVELQYVGTSLGTADKTIYTPSVYEVQTDKDGNEIQLRSRNKARPNQIDG